MTSATPRHFELLAFHRTLGQSEALAAAGVDGLILDFEQRGKHERQAGYDTEINQHALSDVADLKAHTGAYLLCRINGPGPETFREIDAVVAGGADEIIVPMIMRLDDAEDIVRHIGRDAAITLMVETREAVALAGEFSQLPVKRIYIGLNDLHISRGTASIFAPFADGTLDAIRLAVEAPQFGVAGLTLPGRGHPIPVAMIYNELARIGADFTFLRRSFYRDVETIVLSEAIGRMRREMAAAQSRSAEEIAPAHAQLIALVMEMQGKARV